MRVCGVCVWCTVCLHSLALIYCRFFLWFSALAVWGVLAMWFNKSRSWGGATESLLGCRPSIQKLENEEAGEGVDGL
jgi:hypothetical protein